MRPTHSLLASFLLLLATSCGPSDPGTLIDEGFNTLSQDRQASFASFEEALAGIDATHPRFKEATIGKLRAQAFLDPAAAKDGFLAFAAEGQVDSSDYNLLATDFCAAAKTQAASGAEEDKDAALKTVDFAVAIVKAGEDTFASKEKFLTLVSNVGKTAEKLGADASTLEALAGLGYVGGSD